MRIRFTAIAISIAILLFCLAFWLGTIRGEHLVIQRQRLSIDGEYIISEYAGEIYEYR